MIKDSEKESNNKEYSSYYKRESQASKINWGGIFLGLILIAIGVIYFLNITGLYKTQFSFSWTLFLPIGLIFIGLSILSRRGWIFTLVGFLISMAVLAIITLMAIGVFTYRRPMLNQPLAIKKEQNINSAVISVKTEAVKMTIMGGNAELVSGILKSNFLKLSEKSEIVGQVQKVEIEINGRWPFTTGGAENTLELMINPEIPVSLELSTGATELSLDFSNIKLENLNLATGASSLSLTLGDKIDYSKIKIKAGVSSINIFLPKTIGAKLNLNTGLVAKNLNDFKKIEKDVYQSLNYDTANKKIEFDLNLGVSDLNINWK